MSAPRITRSFVTRIPRWSTNHPTHFNWSLLQFWDVVPMFYVIAFVDINSPFMYSLFGLSVLWLMVRMYRRLRERHEWCGEFGHDPYQPIVGVPEWRCWYCDMPLGREEAIAEIVRERAASDRPDPQAKWSDRR